MVELTTFSNASPTLSTFSAGSSAKDRRDHHSSDTHRSVNEAQAKYGLSSPLPPLQPLPMNNSGIRSSEINNNNRDNKDNRDNSNRAPRGSELHHMDYFNRLSGAPGSSRKSNLVLIQGDLSIPSITSIRESGDGSGDCDCDGSSAFSHSSSHSSRSSSRSSSKSRSISPRGRRKGEAGGGGIARARDSVGVSALHLHDLHDPDPDPSFSNSSSSNSHSLETGT